jgi:hypothetical protein
MSFIEPKEFSTYSSENVLKAKDRDFEGLCAAMEEAGTSRPKEMTTFEFYHRVEYYDRKAKAAKKT